MYYTRDVSGRIVYREKDNITAWNWSLNQYTKYGFTGPGDSPSFVKNSSGTVIEKYLALPGCVLLTIYPTQSGNAQKQYSLPNIHGDILLTTNAIGTNTSTGNGPLNSFTYDPFGNVFWSPFYKNVIWANSVNDSPSADYWMVLDYNPGDHAATGIRFKVWISPTASATSTTSMHEVMGFMQDNSREIFIGCTFNFTIVN